MDFWYSFAKTILRGYLTVFGESVHLKGQENLPPGAKIIAPNHPNATDGFVLPFIVPERLYFLMHVRLFSLPVVGRLLALADQIPVTPGRGREALDAARDKLARGGTVVIFPEGYVSPPHSLRRGGAGAVLLALETGAPLVPVGFYVPSESLRTLRARVFGKDTVGRWQMGGQCFVQVGKPWWPSLPAGMERGYRALRDMTEDLMARITALTQQAKQEALRLLAR